MSTNTYHIVDTPLPLSEDYNKLMDDALSYIQAHVGSEWTNLNPSDPGVTILEQVCYALTELGYCNSFSMADILTNAQGELDTTDQFYWPQQILPTSPITLADYRKYLIDGVNGIGNAILLPIANTAAPLSRVYQVYLQTDQPYSPTVTADICKAALYYLNQARNLGELFLLPTPLKPQPFGIGGTLGIEKAQDLEAILQQIQNALAQFIFPTVVATGYNAASVQATDIDTVLNGPLLQKGYIPTEALGTKVNTLWPIDVLGILQQVPGVVSVSGLTLYTAADGKWTPQKSVSSAEGELLTVDLLACLKGQPPLLTITVNNKVVPANALQPMPQPEAQRNPNAAVSLVYGEATDYQVPLPRGSFRDINTYYPLQSTLPAIYGLGGNGTEPNANAQQVAQARQLQAYLTLMDQVLANQFSQLANLGKLFSFKNAVTATPAQVSQMRALYGKKTTTTAMYPAPYQVFSPSYYYQPLYQVPGIQPLLKDSTAFNFSYSPQTDLEALEKYWTAYQADPYNAYMFGLLQLMTDADTDLARRNEMLNHLLARHSESPMLIDAYINGAVYTGHKAQDTVIFKSLYLQNLALLSYNRTKAFNYWGADKLNPCGDVYAEAGQNPAVAAQLAQLLTGDTSDFIVQSGKINQLEKIRAADLVNYATIELQLRLLLGLRVQYRNFMIDYFEEGKTNDQLQAEINLAYWLLCNRCGLLMIETALLLQHLPPPSLPETGDAAAEGNPFNKGLLFIFPNFIPWFATPDFKLQVDFLLQQKLPVYTSFDCYFIDSDAMKEVVDGYVEWHNGMRYQPTDLDSAQQSANAQQLFTVLVKSLNHHT